MAVAGGSGIDLTISIANRNGREFLRACLSSIRETTRHSRYEIVVVDNASTDGSLEMLREEFPEVLVVANETARGYGASHNQGFAAGQGRYFLVLNNDMIVLPCALDAMVARMDRSDDIGVLGCRLQNPNGTLQPSCSRESTILRILMDDFVPKPVPLERIGLRQRMRNWAHDTERDVHVVQGSCMCLPRRIFKDAGRFDEQFDFFREEFDLCRRVRLMGKRIVFFPGATIVHFGGQTMKRVSRLAYEMAFESRYRYFVKHHGRFSGAVVIVSAFLGVLTRLLLLIVVWMIPFVRNRKGLTADIVRYKQTLNWFFEQHRPWMAAGR